MEPKFLYEDILGMLTIIKDDEKKLIEVLTCLENQILGTENRKKKNAISPEYRETIMQIATALENDFVCYLNPDTLEIEQLPRSTVFNMDDYEEQNDDMIDEFDMNYMKWDNYIKFEPPGPNELLIMMEKYVSQLKDSRIGSKLVTALDKINPVSSFIKVINASSQKEDWEEFRQQETINYVNDTLTNKMRLQSEKVI